MKLTDLNPGGGIGANSLLVETGPFRYVVDSGLHPKYAGNDALPELSLVEPDSLDFIVLTHCHLDHLGSLPLLSRKNPDAPILLSRPTQMLARRMLNNSIAVMKRQRAEQNLPEYPLYSRPDVAALRERFQPLKPDETHHFEKDGQSLEITLHHAGHVAGAVSCTVRAHEETVFFTGDLLFTNQRTLDGAKPPLEPVDVLVTETTRGATPRASGVSRESEIVRLLQDLRKYLKRGGCVLIPIFALGRMQEMLVVLDEALRNGAIPPTPVYCSGLGMDLVNYFHDIALQTPNLRFHRKVLKNLGVKTPSRALQPGREPHPGIYLVSSGMLVENTPSYRLAASILHSDRNALLFVGYCDPDTPGGQLLAARNGSTFLFDALDYRTTLRAPIRKYDLSGHADREELLHLSQKLQPKTVFLHHGDPEARQWFQRELSKTTDATVLDPEPLKTYET